MNDLINLPDSFGSYEEAAKHLETCVEMLVSQKLHVSPGLPGKVRIVLLCEALNISHLDIYERVTRGRGG